MNIISRNPGLSVLVAAIVLAVLLKAVWPMTITGSWSMALLAGALALGGLPHGAADAWIALQRGIVRTPLGFLAFLGFYLGLSIAVITIWRMAPVSSLGAFLLLSVWHFGDDRAVGHGPVVRIATGVVILCAPAAFAPADVLSVYRVLSGDYASLLIEVQRILLGPAWLTLACQPLLAESGSQRRRQAIVHLSEISLLVVLSALSEPLIYFGIYFCAVHSPRHLFRILASWRVTRDRSFWPSTLLVTFVSGLAGLGTFLWLLEGGQKLEAATLQVVFIGLAALSLPHILLVDGLLARGKSQR